MTKLSQLKKYAKSIGAEIEVTELLDCANIQAVAPDGKIWVESGGVSLVNWYGYNNKQDKQEAYNDLMQRMQMGLEDEINDYEKN